MPPKIVGHRGLILHAPENSLSGFRACLELRLGFEFDVERTKDNQLVCLHDSTVDRTSNGKGRVANFTLEELKQLDVGQKFDPCFARERVPTVEDVLKLVSEHAQADVLITVDIKASGVEAEIVRLAEKHSVLPRLLFIGRTISDAAVRDQLRTASGQCQCAAVANSADEFQTALEAINADWVYFRYLPSDEEIAKVKAAGKKSFLAGQTVGGLQPENWQRAAERQLDGLLTDYPLECAALFRPTRTVSPQ